MAGFIEVTATNAPMYVTPIIAACHGFVYIGAPFGDVIYEAGNQATAPLQDNGIPVEMAFLNLTIFMVDGVNLVTLDLATGSMVPYEQNQNTSVVGALTSSGATSPYTATLVVGSTAAYSNGETLSISGANLSGTYSPYSGNFAVTIVNSTTLTYEIIATTPPPSPAPGPITLSNTLPVSGQPTNCCLCCNWRGRLVLAGDANNPQNFYMARVGNPYDWNYAATDPAAAVAGNLSTSGQIGAAIMSLIPYTDDYMLIQTADSMWMLEGDPADGGTIVRVAENMGAIGANAWIQDSQAILYFLAQGGMYSLRPIWEMFQPPQLLTGMNYDQYFQALNYSDQLSMVFDPDRHYIYLFDTPGNGTTAGTHLIHDMRNGGLWPQQFPANIGPTCTLAYNPTGGGPARVIVLGGQDGYLRQLDNVSLDDDGTAISAFVHLGPFHPDQEASMLGGLTIDLGEVPIAAEGAAPIFVEGEIPTGTIDGTNTNFNLANTPIEDTQQVFIGGVRQDGVSQYSMSGQTIIFVTAPPLGSVLLANYNYLGSPANPWNAVATLYAGPDAFSVTEGVPIPGTTSDTQFHGYSVMTMILERRQKTMRQRFRAGWFSLMLSNAQPDAYFSFEEATFEFSPAGRNRARR
jgi:hypothetical protein